MPNQPTYLRRRPRNPGDLWRMTFFRKRVHKPPPPPKPPAPQSPWMFWGFIALVAAVGLYVTPLQFSVPFGVTAGVLWMIAAAIRGPEVLD